MVQLREYCAIWLLLDFFVRSLDLHLNFVARLIALIN
jgi:hypothetical protein